MKQTAMTMAARDWQDAAVEIIRAEGVSKHFGKLQVLDDISLAVREGEILALLGASGCGKSTLLNILSGLLTPDAGEVVIQGQSAARFEHWEKVAYMFQEDRLLPWRSVRQNVGFGLENTRLSRAERAEKVDAALRLVGLHDFRNSWPHQLSGGMRSRVALARSLVVEPEILLMDEPFSKLDPQTRGVMHNELLRIQQLKGVTVVMVTHDVEEAVVLADRVVLLKPNPGRIHKIIEMSLPHPRVPTERAVAEQSRLLRLEV
ncbi:ABC transporter ATP-binding protein [Acerihabitans sp.]|uniref:ABC transporter ATP-binding protein n=1 Tax=Acerihabitans sp. TaxID=2811394 RepID=UPI002ED8C8CA